MTNMACCSTELQVLELFCGVGGMHYALKEAGVPFNIKSAIDINTVTNSIYKHNFPDSPLVQRQLQSLSFDEMNTLGFDTVLMSPPCQPFTRVGLKKDSDDRRTDAFFGLLEQMERMTEPPSFILVENVKGFEESSTRDTMISFFKRMNYTYQELLLTPLQFGIPNSRLRYYCLARLSTKGPLPFNTYETILETLPEDAFSRILNTHIFNQNFVNLTTSNTQADSQTPEEITQLIDADTTIDQLDGYLQDDIDFSQYYLSEKDMKYYEGLDTRTKFSRNSCCFTKRYGHYFVGSGSFLKVKGGKDNQLRYFTPREVASLMCFPATFDFPQEITRKQRYKALGNSLNVYVVACLIRLLVLS